MTKKKTSKGIRKSHNKDFASKMILSNAGVRASADLLAIQDSLRSVNDYAAGLSFALPIEGILKTYTDIVETQRNTIESALEIGGRLTLVSQNIVSIIDNAVLPLNNTITEIGLVGASASRLHSLGTIDLEQLQFSNQLSGLALDTIQEQQSILSSGIASIEASSTPKTINEIAPGLQTISCGVSEMMRALPTYPIGAEITLPELEVAREDTEVDESCKSEHQARLDTLLEQINPGLVEFRQGAWDSFNGKGVDYVGHASSSMRRLVDTLLREIAPPEAVTKSKYFKDSPKAKDDKGRPTRRARIMFAIKWDQNKSDRLERLSNGFLESYDHLSAWDHVPIKRDSFVHGVLITIEGYLISILSENLE